MSVIDSALDPEALAQARVLLAPPAKRERLGPVLGAAAVAAIAVRSSVATTAVTRGSAALFTVGVGG